MGRSQKLFKQFQKEISKETNRSEIITNSTKEISLAEFNSSLEDGTLERKFLYKNIDRADTDFDFCAFV